MRPIPSHNIGEEERRLVVNATPWSLPSAPKTLRYGISHRKVKNAAGEEGKGEG